EATFCAVEVVAAGGILDVGPNRPDATDVVGLLVTAMMRGPAGGRTFGEFARDRVELFMPPVMGEYNEDMIRFLAQMKGTPEAFAKSVRYLGDVVLRPTLPPLDFERTRAQEERRLELRANDPSSEASANLWRSLFGVGVYTYQRTASRT